MRMFALSLFVIAALAGCSVFGSGGDSADADDLGQFERVTLEEGETVFINALDVRITFVEKTEDSRCPIGVECVWEGEVQALFQVTPTGSPAQSVTIRGFVDDAGENTVIADAAGFRLTLERLAPYPVDGQADAAPPTATLTVIRL